MIRPQKGTLGTSSLRRIEQSSRRWALEYMVLLREQFSIDYFGPRPSRGTEISGPCKKGTRILLRRPRALKLAEEVSLLPSGPQLDSFGIAL
jgi:hypothetical protein